MSLHLGQSSVERLIFAPHPVNWVAQLGLEDLLLRRPSRMGACGYCLSPGAQPGLRATAVFLPTRALRDSGFLVQWWLGSESGPFIKFRFKGRIYLPAS